MFKTVLPLGLVIFFRFFGLFVVLPVLAIHLLSMPETTPLLIGLAMSGYALTQMIFVAPFGYLSDKIGRKGVILLGTLIFISGSALCYVSTDIYTLIAGRLLQGVGAISAVISALVSDLVKEEARTKAMALIGGSIAMGFTIAMFVGPSIYSSYGINELFLIAGVLGVISFFIIIFAVPNPPQVTHHYNKKPNIKKILKNPSLAIMNITNFLQKYIMTFTFVLVPVYLLEKFSWDKGELWMVYVPATILGFLAMAPASIIAEKRGKPKLPLFIGIILFAVSYLFMNVGSESFFITGVILFFIGFNMHEPIMQSLASKISKVHQKGISLGIFNTFGYFGTFLGGFVGAMVVRDNSFSTFTIIFVTVSIIWILIIAKMKNPAHSKNIYIPLKQLTNKPNKKDLKKIKGLLEWYINDNEKLLIVKYDTTITDEKSILKHIKF
jgi:predicted MFS family arabinose efflux permease